MNLVDIIIPYADYHLSIVEQAIAAASNQSVKCGIIPVHDTEGQGAGWARNKGVALSDSLFVLCCDADDTMREDAVELMIASYQRQGVYIYSDDQQGDSIHETPDCGVYLDGSWHTVNALIPTAAFKAVGGFDETLPALEDKDLFLRLQAAGVCGVRCPHVLVRYTAGGQRSKAFKARPDHNQIYDEIERRWSGVAIMGCGCGSPVSGVIPENKQDSDILATALYTPREMPGPITGRMYQKPRGPSGYQLWIDPRDLDSPAGKMLWSPVKSIDPNVLPAVDDVMRLAQEAMRA